MPHFLIFNLVKIDREDKNITKIEESIVTAVTNIKELNLTKDDISFSFLEDSSVTSENIPIIIIAELLFKKPERTSEVIQRMASAIGQGFQATISQWRTLPLPKLEVAVKKFDPEKDGFWTNIS